jgi:hypothetical protein
MRRKKTYTCSLSKFLKHSSSWSIVPVLNKYNFISMTLYVSMLFYPLYEVAKRCDCKIKFFHDPTVLLLWHPIQSPAKQLVQAGNKIIFIKCVKNRKYHSQFKDFGSMKILLNENLSKRQSGSLSFTNVHPKIFCHWGDIVIKCVNSIFF